MTPRLEFGYDVAESVDVIHIKAYGDNLIVLRLRRKALTGRLLLYLRREELFYCGFLILKETSDGADLVVR